MNKNNTQFLWFKWLCFFAYISLTIYIVFFARRRQMLQMYWYPGLINYVPFKSIIKSYAETQGFNGWDFYVNLIGNIFLFIPMPFFIKVNFKLQSYGLMIIIGFCLSVCIEIVQCLARIGIPDIDDVILNCTGVITGVLMIQMIKPAYFHSAFIREHSSTLQRSCQ